MNIIATGLDYSARRLPGASIRAAGHRFANRYLWFPGQSHAYLTADECRDLTANGVEVHAIYEQNTNDPAGGWNAGVAMARQAVQSAQAAGLPKGSTIFMCADAWLSTHGIPVSTAMSFLDGARSVFGPAGYLTGAYGFADFVYAAQNGGHADRFWLCGAESGVRNGIHMYQWNNGSVVVDGLQCDLNKQYIPMFEGAAGGGGGGDDMPLNADTDYEALKTMMQRMIAFELRPGGAAATWQNGPTIFESLAAINATVAAIANDQDVTPEELDRIINEAVEKHAAKPEDIAKAMAADVAKEIIAFLPRDKDGNLSVDVNEEQIAAEVLRLAGAKLGAA